MARFAFAVASSRGKSTPARMRYELASSIPFNIVALDPDSMTIVETLYATDGAPMGAGTVGLRVGDELFIGSFHGDRILRVNLKAQ
jgi:hypothetical protein